MSTRSSSLGKRLLPALAMTSAASGLVALLDQPSSGSAISAASDTTAVPDQAVVPAATVPPSVSSTLPPAAVQPTTPSVVPQAPAPTQQPATTTPVAAAGGACQGKTIDGPAVDTRWGPVQVEAVISASGQICDVDAIRSPDSHGRSVRINDEALPILHTEVMKAQSANINGVSGATVTSRAYERSLQSILDGVG
ncbi:MAG: FMN-binding protein [Ilumatobacteraceae bacterium]|nr:FMN-binding protein [Ilumatobacteraceae bacterium]